MGRKRNRQPFSASQGKVYALVPSCGRSLLMASFTSEVPVIRDALSSCSCRSSMAILWSNPFRCSDSRALLYGGKSVELAQEGYDLTWDVCLLHLSSKLRYCECPLS